MSRGTDLLQVPNSHDMDSYFKTVEYLFSSVPKQKSNKLREEDGSLEELKFVVLGMDISNWSGSAQYILCTIGVMGFLIMYGLLQELVVMKTFNRSHGWFVTLLQLSGYALCAWVQSVLVGVRIERRIPYRQYTILACLQVLMQGFTNLSMHYLNYPAKMLFKSSRILVTMLVGIVFRRLKYPRKDYAVGLSMAVGLTLFVLADAKTSPVFDIHGVMIICVSLLADGAILNLQEHCMKTYSASHDELVFYSYVGASFIVFGINLYLGEFISGCIFLHENGSFRIFFLIMSFSCCGFLGVSCVAALTKRFGAITAAITSTVRKGITLVLSYVFYPEDKSITFWHIFGGFIFMWGLFVRSVSRAKTKRPKKPGDSIDYNEKDSDVDVDVEDDNEGDDFYYTSRTSVEEDLGSLQIPLQRIPSRPLGKKTEGQEVV